MLPDISLRAAATLDVGGSRASDQQPTRRRSTLAKSKFHKGRDKLMNIVSPTSAGGAAAFHASDSSNNHIKGGSQAGHPYMKKNNTRSRNYGSSVEPVGSESKRKLSHGFNEE